MVFDSQGYQRKLYVYKLPLPLLIIFTDLQVSRSTFSNYSYMQSAVLAIENPSVRPSVRLSVCHTLALQVCGNGFQYSQSLPFPLGHSHSRNLGLCILRHSHSPTIPENSFPFPPTAKSLTNQNILNHTMCVMSFAFTDYNKSPETSLLIAVGRIEYKYIDISDRSKHNRLHLYSPTSTSDFLEQRL